MTFQTGHCKEYDGPDTAFTSIFTEALFDTIQIVCK